MFANVPVGVLGSRVSAGDRMTESWCRSSNKKVDVVAGGEGIISRIETQSHSDLTVLVSLAFVAFGSFHTFSFI